MAGSERDGGAGGGRAGKRCGGRCPGPLAYAAASLACIVAAIAVFDSTWLHDEPARTAIAGALMAASIILAFGVVLSAAVAAVSLPPLPAPRSATVRASDAAQAPSLEAGTPVSRNPSAGTILFVFAVATLAAIALAAASSAQAHAPYPYPAGHMGIVQAMAACHATNEGCGRAAVGGDDGARAHLIAPPFPVIATVGIPAVVTMSGMGRGTDADKDARVL